MTLFQNPAAIVTTDWLADNLDNPDLRIFDCTTTLATSSNPARPYRIVSGRADHDISHIPNAGFLDLQNDLSARKSPFGFTMLPLETLAAAFAAHGIGDNTRVILYSRTNPQWATRLWWMLRAVGFDNAAILDGGWDKWQAENRATSDAPATYAPATLTLHARPDAFVGKDAVLAGIDDPACCTINALSADLHRGESARYGRAGRVPNSVNLPANDLLDPDTRTLLAPATIARAFDAVGADPAKRSILYCGGGIWATMNAFLLLQLGHENVSVYDASLSEWATDPALPVEVG